MYACVPPAYGTKHSDLHHGGYLKGQERSVEKEAWLTSAVKKRPRYTIPRTMEVLPIQKRMLPKNYWRISLQPHASWVAEAKVMYVDNTLWVRMAPTKVLLYWVVWVPKRSHTIHQHLYIFTLLNLSAEEEGIDHICTIYTVSTCTYHLIPTTYVETVAWCPYII